MVEPAVAVARVTSCVAAYVPPLGLNEGVATRLRTARLRFLVLLSPSPSATRMVKVEEPAAVGVPLIKPDPVSTKPGGSEPEEIDQESAPSPPVACNWLV